MDPARGVQFSSVHSLIVNDEGDALSLWLEMTDGSTRAIDLPLDADSTGGHHRGSDVRADRRNTAMICRAAGNSSYPAKANECRPLQSARPLLEPRAEERSQDPADARKRHIGNKRPHDGIDQT